MSIESLIESEDWKAARRLIRQRLKHSSDNHWLLTRLGLTYYEEKNYTSALTLTEKALSLAPHCPLVLWDYAGCLHMLKHYAVAIRVYKKLAKRGVHSIATDECGEGLAKARGLVADCYFRIAQCYKALKKYSLSKYYFKKHIAERGPGCHSIYTMKLAQDNLKSLEK